MSNSLITIDFLNKKVQPYFIENKNYTDQSSIRSLIIDLKEICSKLNHSLQKLKPENFDPQIQIPSSSSITFKWAYLEQKKLTIKYNQRRQSIVQERIDLLDAIINDCNNILNNNSKIEIIPLIPLIQDVSIDDILKDKTSKLTNKIFFLQNYLLSKSFFPIPNSSTKEMTNTMKYLYQKSDEQTKWFPRCDASERIESFISTYMKFDNTRVQKFLPSIFRNAQQFLKLCNLKTEYFPTAYLLCYRAAFDLYYPQFFENGINPDFLFKKKLAKTYCEETNDMFLEGKKILDSILFETNPIDIGYQISFLLNTDAANIATIEYKQNGKQIPAFISAEECVNVIQYMLFKFQFTYSVHLLPLIDRFCSDKDFPTNFKYACQNFRIATIDLFEQE